MGNFLPAFVQLFPSVSLLYAVLVLVELRPIDLIFFSRQLQDQILSSVPGHHACSP